MYYHHFFQNMILIMLLKISFFILCGEVGFFRIKKTVQSLETFVQFFYKNIYDEFLSYIISIFLK